MSCFLWLSHTYPVLPPNSLSSNIAVIFARLQDSFLCIRIGRWWDTFPLYLSVCLFIFICRLCLLESIHVFDRGTTHCHAGNNERLTLDWSPTDVTTGMMTRPTSEKNAISWIPSDDDSADKSFIDQISSLIQLYDEVIAQTNHRCFLSMILPTSSFWIRAEEKLSRLSTRANFWNKDRSSGLDYPYHHQHLRDRRRKTRGRRRWRRAKILLWLSMVSFLCNHTYIQEMINYLSASDGTARD